MDKILRQWIKQIIQKNEPLIRIAVRQRAKFEGWLKFELAAIAEKNGAESVEVETSAQNGESTQRADISLTYQGISYDIELKTPNTNWRMAGVTNAHRPITKNVAEIIKDGEKLRRVKSGLVAFVMFPIPPDDNQWKFYIARIAKDLECSVSTQDNCDRVEIMVDSQHKAELVVCAFSVSNKLNAD